MRLEPQVRDLCEAASELFGRVGQTLPTYDDLADSPLDWVGLAEGWDEFAEKGWEPALVITPWLPLDGEQSWKALYRSLKHDDTIPGNAIANDRYDDGLSVEADVAAAWGELSGEGTRPEGLEIGIVASSPKVPGFADWGDFNHPTVSLYLAVQALRIQAGLQPLDRESLCWLADMFEGDQKTVFGTFHLTEFTGMTVSQVGLFQHPKGEAKNPGVRPVVWARQLDSEAKAAEA